MTDPITPPSQMQERIVGNWHTTLAGLAAAAIIYIQGIGGKLPETNAEWIQFGLGLLVAIVGALMRNPSLSKLKMLLMVSVIGSTAFYGCPAKNGTSIYDLVKADNVEKAYYTAQVAITGAYETLTVLGEAGKLSKDSATKANEILDVAEVALSTARLYMTAGNKDKAAEQLTAANTKLIELLGFIGEQKNG